MHLDSSPFGNLAGAFQVRSFPLDSLLPFTFSPVPCLCRRCRSRLIFVIRVKLIDSVSMHDVYDDTVCRAKSGVRFFVRGSHIEDKNRLAYQCHSFRYIVSRTHTQLSHMQQQISWFTFCFSPCAVYSCATNKIAL